jgi:dTDP-4-dehydrorhamnose 3,5-epimerase
MKLSIDAQRDPQSVTPDWQAVTTKAIEGVVAREVKPVLMESGSLVELLRAEWLGGSDGVAQVFLRTIDPGAVSAWHVHHATTDRLFCVGGRALVVLYDARVESLTHGVVAEYLVGSDRPTLLIVPPGVYHGLKALGAQPEAIVNMPDEAYSYVQPDHWRLPSDSIDIPYSFDDPQEPSMRAT